ncbi:MAG: outer membrane protein assembly factor BamD [Candidatus Kapaibacterium sp.]|jgi:outer membrane protein assembly factor BamD
MIHIARLLLLPLALLWVSSFIGCGTSYELDTKDPASIFRAAMIELEDEDWLESEKLFDLIRLQYPSSPYADDAQFYIGELHFRKGEHILASFNFDMVRRSYPMSELSRISRYKSALCYYELSPPFDRDQDYTKKAIQHFAEYQALYPDDSLYMESGKKIDELRNKLARREYETAEIYRKLYTNKSALVYYDFVIEDYPDTEYYEAAFVGKIEALSDLKRKDELRATIEQYNARIPNGTMRDRVMSIANSLP